MMGRWWSWCALVVVALVASFGCGSDDSQSASRASGGTSPEAGTSGAGPAGRGGESAGGRSAGGATTGGASSGTSGVDAGAAAIGGTVSGRGGAGGAAGDPGGGPGSTEGGAAGEDAGPIPDAGSAGTASTPIDMITDTVTLVPDDRGFVAPGSNPIGVHGAWSASNDCETSPGDCTANHQIGPKSQEVPFDTRPFPSDGGAVCMSGVTASVNEDSEYATKWGARLLLPLNEGPNGELQPYDAAARGIGAFGVNLELRGPSMVDSSIRIALLVDGVEDTHSREYYGITQSSTFIAEFKRVKQGNGAEPFSVFDPTRVTAIELTFPTRMGFELPFDICITGVVAIPAALYEPDLSKAPELPSGTHLVPLSLSADGEVLPNAAGIEGAWFAENDCTTSPDDCTADQTPAPGGPFPIEDNRACASGVVDPVGASTEYETKWGAAIGLYLNRPDPAQPAAAYDAAAHGVLGFAYKLRSYNIEPIRTEAISVGVAEPHLYEVTQAGVHALRFDYLRQGDWVDEPSALDTTQLTALRFHVPSGPGVVRPFDFCIEELAAIVED